MNTTEIILYIVLVILVIIISHIVYNYNYNYNSKVSIYKENNKTIERFGAEDNSINVPTTEPKGSTIDPYTLSPSTSDNPNNPDSPNSPAVLPSGGELNEPLPPLQCVAKLKLNSPLHSCNALTAFITNKISNYNEIIDDLKNIFSNLDIEIEKVKEKYGAIVDAKIDAYKVSEDTVRQQSYFKTQNGNVININTKYKDELSKKTDSSKETYNIQLDLFNKAKDKDESLDEKKQSLIKYCKYTMVILIVILLLNLMVSEFND